MAAVFDFPSITSELSFCGWMGPKMVDRDVKRALLSAYRNGIVRYQKLLKTHQTEVERDYVKERLSACNAAVKALSGPESKAICIWKPKYLAESRQRRSESGVFRKRQFEPLESYNGALPECLPGSNALQVSARKQN